MISVSNRFLSLGSASRPRSLISILPDTSLPRGSCYQRIASSGTLARNRASSSCRYSDSRAVQLSPWAGIPPDQPENRWSIKQITWCFRIAKTMAWLDRAKCVRSLMCVDQDIDCRMRRSIRAALFGLIKRPNCNEPTSRKATKTQFDQFD